eukprot:11612689-Alexandrium_andersonii.AAC.1
MGASQLRWSCLPQTAVCEEQRLLLAKEGVQETPIVGQRAGVPNVGPGLGIEEQGEPSVEVQVLGLETLEHLSLGE